MRNKNERKKDIIECIKKGRKWGGLVIVIIAMPFLISYFSFIPLEGNLDAWIGFWGSMFGSLLAIVGSVYLLQKQIADSKESLQEQISNDNRNIQEQRKEETFYNLLNLFLREQDRLKEESVKSKKDIIKKILTEIKGGYSQTLYWDYYQDTPGGKEMVKQGKISYQEFFSLKEEQFFFDEVQTAIVEQVLDRKYSILGNYFRMFYRTLKYINDNFEEEFRKEHLGTLRAVLPEFELLLIFNNAFYTHRGKNMKEQFTSTNFFGDATDFINVDNGKDHIFFQLQHLSKPEFIVEKMKECFSTEEEEKYRETKEPKL
ncbi:putative phage abortive infection protein [Lactococcus petauri]|uniref:putative phage abortive infection protein n=1 Tax=Lactococcus petauri TaxID=1940789 RepID=UPI003852E293